MSSGQAPGQSREGPPTVASSASLVPFNPTGQDQNSILEDIPGLFDVQSEDYYYVHGVTVGSFTPARILANARLLEADRWHMFNGYNEPPADVDEYFERAHQLLFNFYGVYIGTEVSPLTTIPTGHLAIAPNSQVNQWMYNPAYLDYLREIAYSRTAPATDLRLGRLQMIEHTLEMYTPLEPAQTLDPDLIVNHNRYAVFHAPWERDAGASATVYALARGYTPNYGNYTRRRVITDYTNGMDDSDDSDDSDNEEQWPGTQRYLELFRAMRRARVPTATVAPAATMIQPTTTQSAPPIVTAPPAPPTTVAAPAPPPPPPTTAAASAPSAPSSPPTTTATPAPPDPWGSKLGQGGKVYSAPRERGAARAARIANTALAEGTSRKKSKPVVSFDDDDDDDDVVNPRKRKRAARKKSPQDDGYDSDEDGGNGDEDNPYEISSDDDGPRKKRKKTTASKKRPASKALAASKSASKSKSPEKEATKSSWSDEEQNLCQALVQSIKEAWAEKHSIDELWEQVSDELKKAGFNRTPGGIKNYWSRYGRAASGYDERATKRPDALVTGSLDGPGPGRLPGKAKSGQKEKES